MKYFDLLGKDTGVNLKNVLAEAMKNSLDVGYARSAMHIPNKNGGSAEHSTVVTHDYYLANAESKVEGPCHCD